MRLSVLLCDWCGREEKWLAAVCHGKMDLCDDCIIDLAKELFEALPDDKREEWFRKMKECRKAIVIERCGPQC